MGLLIGVGSTKPTFAYDYYYGVEWDTTVQNPKLTRIGKDELHKSLPLQSLVRRCLLSDDGAVNTYLNANDSTLTDTGAKADLTGASGQYMVELPDTYVRFETDGTTNRCLMSAHALPGFTLWRKDYISAVEATVQRSTLKLSSVCNTDADYRGGNNDSARDGTYRTQLGVPATSINLTNFRSYARNRGTSEWNCQLYQTYKKLYWLFVVEYATFFDQDTFNAELTEEGYRQGGLGAGVTNINSAKWNALNGYYPFVPCGTTNELGNHTGVVEYTMPFEYDASGAANYAGEYDSATAYTTGQFVSSGDLLYKCNADAAAGTALTDTTYFSEVTRTATYVPSYRGVENPFGHVWKWTDGLKCMIQSDADGGISEFYTCDNPDNFNSSGTDGYVLRGNLPRKEGYVKTVLLGENGEMLPKEVGAGTTTYFTVYFYTNIPTTGTSERGVLFGGNASNGAFAGFAYAYSINAATYAYAAVGSRLCFYPAIATA